MTGNRRATRPPRRLARGAGRHIGVLRVVGTPRASGISGIIGPARILGAARVIRLVVRHKVLVRALAESDLTCWMASELGLVGRPSHRINSEMTDGVNTNLTEFVIITLCLLR